MNDDHTRLLPCSVIVLHLLPRLDKPSLVLLGRTCKRWYAVIASYLERTGYPKHSDMLCAMGRTPALLDYLGPAVYTGVVSSHFVEAAVAAGLDPEPLYAKLYTSRSQFVYDSVAALQRNRRKAFVGLYREYCDLVARGLADPRGRPAVEPGHLTVTQGDVEHLRWMRDQQCLGTRPDWLLSALVYGDSPECAAVLFADPAMVYNERLLYCARRGHRDIPRLLCYYVEEHRHATMLTTFSEGFFNSLIAYNQPGLVRLLLERGFSVSQLAPGTLVGLDDPELLGQFLRSATALQRDALRHQILRVSDTHWDYTVREAELLISLGLPIPVGFVGRALRKHVLDDTAVHHLLSRGQPSMTAVAKASLLTLMAALVKDRTLAQAHRRWLSDLSQRLVTGING